MCDLCCIFVRKGGAASHKRGYLHKQLLRTVYSIAESALPEEKQEPSIPDPMAKNRFETTEVPSSVSGRGPDVAARDGISRILSAVSQTVLSCGSGDASQQVAMVKRGCRNLTVTFYDSEDTVLTKYPCAKANLAMRATLSAERLVFGVDATALTSALGSFGIVFFYFPHTGVTGSAKAVATSDQALLRGFFNSVHNVLKPGGEVQVALSTSPFYTAWNVQSLVPKGMVPKGKVPLDKAQFPGYVHRLTRGMGGRMKRVKDKNPVVFMFGFEHTELGLKEGTSHLQILGATVRLWLVPKDGPPSGAELERHVAHYLRSVRGDQAGLNVKQIFDMFPAELQRGLEVYSLRRCLHEMVGKGALQVALLKAHET
jgi:hypothetical protein